MDARNPHKKITTFSHDEPEPPAVRHLQQKALARRFGVTARTLERWRRQGVGPAYLKLNGRVAYRLEDIEVFEEACWRSRTSGEAHQ